MLPLATLLVCSGCGTVCLRLLLAQLTCPLLADRCGWLCCEASMFAVAASFDVCSSGQSSIPDHPACQRFATITIQQQHASRRDKYQSVQVGLVPHTHSLAR